MMQFSWAMILIPVVLFVGISLAVRFVSLVMGMSRHDDRGSRLHAIGMTAAIGVGLFLAANVLLRPRLTGNSQR